MFADIMLNTHRLILRPFSFSDLDDIYAIISDDDVMRFLPDDRMSKERFHKILNWLIECYKNNTPENIIKFTIAIELKETGKLIGWCGLGPLEFKPEDIEIYYGLSKYYWGKGLGTEAGLAVLGYGFDGIGLKRITAIVNPINYASIRVLEKIKMRFMGTVGSLDYQFKSHEADLFYALTADEYRALR